MLKQQVNQGFADIAVAEHANSLCCAAIGQCQPVGDISRDVRRVDPRRIDHPNMVGGAQVQPHFIQARPSANQHKIAEWVARSPQVNDLGINALIPDNEG